MDQLKKIVADRMRSGAGGPHPDAEVLSAFSENALPAKERVAVLEHLSTCSDCRDIVFFAAPSAEETQKVLPAPKPRRVFALRWGTLAACIIIAGAVLLSRREMPRTQQADLKGAPTANSAPAQDATHIVASEKPPAELNSLHDQEVRSRRVATATRGYAAPKDSTALPAAPMAFEGYNDKISPSRADRERDAKLDRQIFNAPVVGQNAEELAKASPAAAPALKNEISQAQVVAGNANLPKSASTPEQSAYTSGIGGAVKSSQATNGFALINKDALHLGSVTGTVSDASGALITNAKVTVVGPEGQKSATSDAAGRFSFDQLAAGSYLFNVDAPGFRKTVSEVAVLSEKPTKADFRLQVGSAAETVIVQQAAAEAQPAVTRAFVQNPVRDESILLSQAQAQAKQAAQTAELKKKQKEANQRRAHVGGAPTTAPQWSLSSIGGVQRSNDNGRTWVPISVGHSGSFRAIASITNQVWAGGTGGVLFHSSDNGQHWSQVVPSVLGEKLTADITQIQLPAPQHIVLITSSGQAWMSADGGQTWFRQ